MATTKKTIKKTAPVDKPAEKVESVKIEIKRPEILVEVFDSPEDKEVLKAVDEKIDEEQKSGKEKYYETVGRRKNATARVRLYTKKSTDTIKDEKALIIINGKDYTEYFLDGNLQLVVESPLKRLKSIGRFKATVMVNGGGLSGQAGAVRHGLARALTLFDANFRKKLKKANFLKRDPRAKERRKYGLKKARKSPQWSKR
ncbi:MAG TPA: 30S ribosomal protein S9 [Candidatus Yanofskybacteria bacterium]|uniref:Small ribosomal subunit protein uS9 n=1 Tax=Candidatus Yanofskybacteria bacterium GW2011_GWE2_40_11 TaxID=1619033 RepID=A0A0G0QUZ9_9BACT|nr:MAG: 30S ribosomal protein S9 [Candidatus Yanofskybacteria bacterium GW2011_GWE2_40_11]HAU07998.1 30S ribosomal protein S9 [Candidatus Yanofskybacteria bacterium]HBT80613.1 30S ribosomal protein S9 [Candidatus Yanofskybacteria bacterium]HBX58460.1 30S ribosomal protein S9 [Candidatus Yanofskybacteria bacterium]